MHMPPRPPNPPILGWRTAAGEARLLAAAAALRLALRLELWPVPPGDLPPGTAVVGGAVRDGLLGRLPARPDLDLVVPGDAIALCHALARRHGGRTVVLDPRRSIARLVLSGWTLDVARQAGEDLAEDLWRRDFRLNALALPLDGQACLLDPTGGLEDLIAGQLTAVRERNLLEDPLRLLRGVRLAAELGFRLEPGTWEGIRRHRSRLPQVAPERVLLELEKLAHCPAGGEGLARALDGGLLDPWRPGGDPAKAAGPWLRRLGPRQAEERGLVAPLAGAALALARLAILFDAEGLTRLRSSRRLQQRCARLRHWQLRLLGGGGQAAGPEDGPDSRIGDLSEPERLGLHRQLEADLPALLLIFSAPLAHAWMARWHDPSDRLFHPRSPVDGRELQQSLGLSPSPRLGALLEHLRLEAAFGRLHDHDEALASARIWLEGHSA